MISLLAIMAAGFFLGMRHATDPDHVIAVTTIVARHRSIRHAAAIGAYWGLGHALTLFVVGGGILLLGWVIPEHIGLSMEFSVGLMLILLGGWNLVGIIPWIRRSLPSDLAIAEVGHSHAHNHGEYVHTHSNGHVPESHPRPPETIPLGWLDRMFRTIGVYQIIRPLIIGIVHGLAGSAAIALLVLTTIRNMKWATVYLCFFGLGNIMGMMLITVAMALPFSYTDTQSFGSERGLRIASGLISIGFGFFMVYEIGIVNGLFTGHPQ